MMLATSNSLGTLAELCGANFEKSNLNNLFTPPHPPKKLIFSPKTQAVSGPKRGRSGQWKGMGRKRGKDAEKRSLKQTHKTRQLVSTTFACVTTSR